MPVGLTSAVSISANSADSVSYTFTDSGEQDQAILVIDHAAGGIDRTLNSITLDGVSGTVFNAVSADGGQFSRLSACIWKESELPSSDGSVLITPSYSGTINQHQLTVYHLHTVDQTTPLSGFLSNSATNQTSPHTISTTQASNAGEFGIAAYGYADDTSPPSGTSNFALSVNQTEVSDFANTVAGTSRQAMGSGYDASIASSSELFDADCTHSADMDAITTFSLIVEAPANVNVLANTETLLLTEHQASISLDINILANTETLVLTEQQASISLDINILANTETLLLTEHQASITFDVNVLATPEEMVLTEHQAEIALAIDVQAKTEALFLTEHPASIGYDVNVFANPETLFLTEHQATIGFDIDVNANSESLVLTEHPAKIALDTYITAITASLILTENQATITNVALVPGNVLNTVAVAPLNSTEAIAPLNDTMAVAPLNTTKAG